MSVWPVVLAASCRRARPGGRASLDDVAGHLFEEADVVRVEGHLNVTSNSRVPLRRARRSLALSQR